MFLAQNHIKDAVLFLTRVQLDHTRGFVRQPPDQQDRTPSQSFQKGAETEPKPSKNAIKHLYCALPTPRSQEWGNAVRSLPNSVRKFMYLQKKITQLQPLQSESEGVAMQSCNHSLSKNPTLHRQRVSPGRLRKITPTTELRPVHEASTAHFWLVS